MNHSRSETDFSETWSTLLALHATAAQLVADPIDLLFQDVRGRSPRLRVLHRQRDPVHHHGAAVPDQGDDIEALA